MLVLQPAEWSKPRASPMASVDGPGKWIVLASQTGGDEGHIKPTWRTRSAPETHRRASEASAGPAYRSLDRH